MNFIKKFIIILFLICLNIENSYTFENKILFKVENEIITTIDIYEEIKLLKKFNPEVNSLNETDLLEIRFNILNDHVDYFVIIESFETRWKGKIHYIYEYAFFCKIF